MLGLDKDVKAYRREECDIAGFGIVIYITCNRTNSLNSAIVFWKVARPKRLRRLSVLDYSSRMGDPLGSGRSQVHIGGYSAHYLLSILIFPKRYVPAICYV